jgi:CBS domain-containing protein
MTPDKDSSTISVVDAGLGPGVTPARGLTARDLMSAPAVACRDSAFFEEVAEILADNDISGMPVVNGAGRVVGVISERDLAHAVGGPMIRLALRRHSHHRLPDDVGDLPRAARRAQDIMTTPPLTAAPDTTLDEVAGLMRQHQINRVPVLEDGLLVGVITRGDVLAAIPRLQHKE